MNLTKTEAFTLIELLISLLISSLLSAFIYVSLALIYQRQRGFYKKNEEMIMVSTLQRVLNHDFRNASYIIAIDSKVINCVSDSNQVVYVFDDAHILRIRENQSPVIDTFQISCKKISFALEGNEVQEDSSIVDAVTFQAQQGGNNCYIYCVQRSYTIADKIFMENRYRKANGWFKD